MSERREVVRRRSAWGWRAWRRDARGPGSAFGSRLRGRRPRSRPREPCAVPVGAARAPNSAGAANLTRPRRWSAGRLARPVRATRDLATPPRRVPTAARGSRGRVDETQGLRWKPNAAQPPRGAPTTRATAAVADCGLRLAPKARRAGSTAALVRVEHRQRPRGVRGRRDPGVFGRGVCAEHLRGELPMGWPRAEAGRGVLVEERHHRKVLRRQAHNAVGVLQLQHVPVVSVRGGDAQGRVLSVVLAVSAGLVEAPVSRRNRWAAP